MLSQFAPAKMWTVLSRKGSLGLEFESSGKGWEAVYFGWGGCWPHWVMSGLTPGSEQGSLLAEFRGILLGIEPGICCVWFKYLNSCIDSSAWVEKQALGVGWAWSSSKGRNWKITMTGSRWPSGVREWEGGEKLWGGGATTEVLELFWSWEGNELSLIYQLDLEFIVTCPKP